MITVKGTMECGHTVTMEVAALEPFQPNQNHQICNACGGGHFAVLRIEPIDDPGPVGSATGVTAAFVWRRAEIEAEHPDAPVVNLPIPTEDVKPNETQAPSEVTATDGE